MKKSILYISPESLSETVTGALIEVLGDLIVLSKSSDVTAIFPKGAKASSQINEILLAAKIDVIEISQFGNILKHNNVIKNLKKKNKNNFDVIIFSCFRTFHYALFGMDNAHTILKSHGSIAKWCFSNLISLKFSGDNIRNIFILIMKVIYYSLAELLMPLLVKEIRFINNKADNITARLLKKNIVYNQLNAIEYFKAKESRLQVYRRSQKSLRCMLAIGDWRLPHNLSELQRLCSKIVPDDWDEINIVGNIKLKDLNKLQAIDDRIKLHGYVHDISLYMEKSGTWLIGAGSGSGIPIKLIEACLYADQIICSEYCKNLIDHCDLNARKIRVKVL